VHCASTAAGIRQAMQAMRALDAETPPPAVHQALLQAFRAHHEH
jgi:hypothetical protein